MMHAPTLTFAVAVASNRPDHNPLDKQHVHTQWTFIYSMGMRATFTQICMLAAARSDSNGSSRRHACLLLLDQIVMDRVADMHAHKHARQVRPLWSLY
jgi:hypothetical protein